MAEKKRKIIFDVDTGSDDALALMAGILSPEFEIVGICTVNGNLPVPNTTENTLRVVELMKADIPVYPKIKKSPFDEAVEKLNQEIYTKLTAINIVYIYSR